MPASEIDDIFASSKGKGKGKGIPTPQPVTVASSSKTSISKGSGKLAAKEKSTHQKKPPSGEDGKPLRKQKTAETVVDPSLRLSSKSSTPAPKFTSEKASKKRKRANEDEQRFKDSRGSGPSMSPMVAMCSTCHTMAIRAQNRGRVSHLQRRRARYHRSGWG